MEQRWGTFFALVRVAVSEAGALSVRVLCCAVQAMVCGPHDGIDAPVVPEIVPSLLPSATCFAG